MANKITTSFSRFPNTDCYLVTYVGGSCGGLITTLLSSLVLDKDICCVPTIAGNSHDGLDMAQGTWDNDSMHNYYQNGHLHVDNVYLYAKPKEIESTIILSHLATITGKDITPNIENYYNDWLGKQEFIENVRDA